MREVQARLCQIKGESGQDGMSCFLWYRVFGRKCGEGMDGSKSRR